jgi:hypothetical protein
MEKLILQHRFPFQLLNRTCATALSVCLHMSDPISAVTVPSPSTPTPAPVYLVFASTTTLRAAERGWFVSFLATVFRTAKIKVCVNLRGPRTKQEQSVICGKGEKLTTRNSRHNIHIPPRRRSSSRVRPSRLPSILCPSVVLRPPVGEVPGWIC